MNKIALLLIIIPFISFCQSYETKSGIVFSVGDTIRIGQPLSHLGWKSIYTEENEDMIKNKNLIDQYIVIEEVDTIYKSPRLSFKYYNKKFYINIDDALANKEIIPDFKRSLANEAPLDKYDALMKLKKLYDDGVLTEEEYLSEKKKILKS